MWITIPDLLHRYLGFKLGSLCLSNKPFYLLSYGPSLERKFVLKTEDRKQVSICVSRGGIWTATRELFWVMENVLKLGSGDGFHYKCTNFGNAYFFSNTYAILKTFRYKSGFEIPPGNTEHRK